MRAHVTPSPRELQAGKACTRQANGQIKEKPGG